MLPRDPQDLITGHEGRYCVVFDYTQSVRLDGHEKVHEAGDKPPLTAHAGDVLLVLKEVFPSNMCRLSSPSPCWGRWRANKYTFHGHTVT